MINKEKEKPDGRLRCRVSWQGQRLETLVGYRVMLQGWNTSTQRCKRNSFHHDISAQKINGDIEKMESIFADILDSVDSITKEELRARYEAAIDPHRATSGRVNDLIERFILEESSHWSDGTAKRFLVVRNRLREYAPNLVIDDMTAEWFSTYTRHLVKSMKNTTVNKEIKILKWFIRWCKRKGLTAIDVNDFSTRLKVTPKKVIFLDWEELMTFNSVQLHNIHHQEVRDTFVFCCFTGLRFSDVKALKRSDIHGDIMTVTTIKTGDLVDIPLNKYARAILDKYKDVDLGGMALPVCNNAEMNEALKEVAQICELNEEITVTYYQGAKRHDETVYKHELITTHTARRTFICNALMLGMSAETVMKFTGHSSYSAMKPYIDITEQAKRDAMSLFDRK